MYDIINIIEPTSLSEAIEALSNNPSLKMIAGGTDVLIRMHHGSMLEVELLSLRKIPQLNKVNRLEDGTISIGAMTSFSQLFRSELINQYIPILAESSVSMGGPQIRNMATIGGNICNGAVSADSAPALFCLNALLKIESKNNTRVVPIIEFYEGPGKVRLNEGEILTEILITKENYLHLVGKYIKFSNRKAMDIAMLSVAVMSKIENNKLSDLRIALGVAAPTPIRCQTAEQYALNKELTEETIAEISRLAVRGAKARDSWRGSKAYREHLIEVLTTRAIKETTSFGGGVSE